MRVIGKNEVDEFKRRHPNARSSISAWLAEAENATWHSWHEIKDRYGTASFLKNNQVVFNIKGNDYRLKVAVEYKSGIVMILKIGTHKEYDSW